MALHYAGGTDTVRYGSAWSSSTGTVAFWMKTTQTTANVQLVGTWSSTSRTGWAVLLNVTAGKIDVDGYDSATARVVLTSTGTVNDGNWHHIAYNWNVASGGTNTLYVDGTQQATTTSGAVWSVGNSNHLVTGASEAAFWGVYVGDLAEVALWGNRQLVADEIAALAKGFSPLLINPTHDDTTTPSRRFYAPMIASASDLLSAQIGTFTGTSFSDHPRMIGR